MLLKLTRTVNFVHHKSVMFLIPQYVSTSEGHFQAGSIKYIKGILYHFISF